MLEKVISGGQIGADRIAVAVAMSLGLETGGTAPKGFRTQRGDDPTLKDYGLVEHRSRDYPPRTRMNVQDSDGTIIFAHNLNSPGTRLTKRACDEDDKPFLVNPTPEHFARWVEEYEIVTLNVAGNRSFTDIETIKEVIEAGMTE